MRKEISVWWFVIGYVLGVILFTSLVTGCSCNETTRIRDGKLYKATYIIDVYAPCGKTWTFTSDYPPAESVARDRFKYITTKDGIEHSFLNATIYYRPSLIEVKPETTND